MESLVIENIYSDSGSESMYSESLSDNVSAVYDEPEAKYSSHEVSEQYDSVELVSDEDREKVESESISNLNIYNVENLNLKSGRLIDTPPIELKNPKNCVINDANVACIKNIDPILCIKNNIDDMDRIPLEWFIYIVKEYKDTGDDNMKELFERHTKLLTSEERSMLKNPPDGSIISILKKKMNVTF